MSLPFANIKLNKKTESRELYELYNTQYSLEHQIKLITHQMGWGFTDTNDLCEWIVDSPGLADIDPDHWMNVRPY